MPDTSPSKQEIRRQLVKTLTEIGLIPATRANSAPQYGGSTWATLDEVLDPVQWDWPGWLPRGFLTILASEPGAGKSSLCLRLAASYLAGRPWPDGTTFTAERGQILWCESEAGHDLNLDRVRRWGLDPAQIITPLANSRQNFKLDNNQHVLALVAHAGRDTVRLVILDSLSGLLSHRSSARATGEYLTLLANLAQAIGKPILLTHHLRKRATSGRDSRVILDHLRGSSVIAQVARVIWALDTPDPAGPNQRRLSVIKNNLAPFPQPIGMTIDNQGLHFSPLPQPPTAHSELDRATDFLRDLLAGDPLPVNHIKAKAQAAGLSGPTIQRAKKRLGIKSKRPLGKAEWYWELPPENQANSGDN